jgi:hypothetical protein
MARRSVLLSVSRGVVHLRVYFYMHQYSTVPEGMEICDRELRLFPASTDWDFSLREGDTLCLINVSSFTPVSVLFVTSAGSRRRCDRRHFSLVTKHW